MKQKKTDIIVRIILWTLTALILLGILLWGLGVGPFTNLKLWDGISFGNWVRYEDSPDYLTGGASISAQDIRALEINWVSGSITLTVTDGDQISFRENSGLSEDDQLRYRVKDGQLIIQYCQSKQFWFFGSNSHTPPKNLTIEIPRSLAEQLSMLELDTVGARIEGSGLTARTCEIDSISGPVSLQDCSFRDLEMDTISGTLQFSGNADNVELDSMSGSLELYLDRVPQGLEADTVSGDVQLTLPADASFSIALDTVSGDLSSQFPTTKHGDVYYCGNGGNEFRIDTVSGNVTIVQAVSR